MGWEKKCSILPPSSGPKTSYHDFFVLLTYILEPLTVAGMWGYGVWGVSPSVFTTLFYPVCVNMGQFGALIRAQIYNFNPNSPLLALALCCKSSPGPPHWPMVEMCVSLPHSPHPRKSRGSENTTRIFSAHSAFPHPLKSLRSTSSLKSSLLQPPQFQQSDVADLHPSLPFEKPSWTGIKIF